MASFNKKEIEFLKSIGLPFNFERLSDDELVHIEMVVGEKLQREGFDEKYEPNECGTICESILDKLN